MENFLEFYELVLKMLIKLLIGYIMIEVKNVVDLVLGLLKELVGYMVRS